MGKVLATFRLWNLNDEDAILSGQKKPIEEECLIDSGTVSVVIPERVAGTLSLRREANRARVTFADGRTELRDIAVGLRMEIMGRTTECRAIIEPGRDSILVGQIPLEDLDLLVDCKEQKLVPRDPAGTIHEVLAA